MEDDAEYIGKFIEIFLLLKAEMENSQLSKEELRQYIKDLEEQQEEERQRPDQCEDRRGGREALPERH